MRASGVHSALVTASVVSLVTGGCTAAAGMGTTRAAGAVGAPVGGASPDSTGYNASGTLEAVAATSATNAWAVGNRGQGSLIVHWNGSTWSSVPTGAPADSGLGAVAASPPGNAWAVGATFGGGSTISTAMILHWNGRAWRQVPSPVPSNSDLSSVAVTSPANAWAVGGYFTTARHFASSARLIALHWNGSTWRRVPLPRLPVPAGGGAQLNGVSATSATDAWAVGVFLTRLGTYGAGFVLHWNGSSWSQVPSAPGSAGDPIAVASTATDYGWLLGAVTAGAVTGLWNGHRWTTVPVPLVKTLPFDKGGSVSALGVSGHSAWVAGEYCTTKLRCENGLLLPLLLRWTGSGWQLTPPPGNNVIIFGLAVTSPANAWAVGYTPPSTSEEKARIVILHWNGSKWSDAPIR